MRLSHRSVLACSCLSVLSPTTSIAQVHWDPVFGRGARGVDGFLFNGLYQNQVTRLRNFGPDLLIAGSFQSTYGSPSRVMCESVARVSPGSGTDDVVFSPLGSGLVSDTGSFVREAIVSDMEVLEQAAWFVGDFTNAGGHAAFGGLARWREATGWDVPSQGLPTGFSARALGIFMNELYLVVEDGSITGSCNDFVYKWNSFAANWSPIGSAIDADRVPATGFPDFASTPIIISGVPRLVVGGDLCGVSTNRALALIDNAWQPIGGPGDRVGPVHSWFTATQFEEMSFFGGLQVSSGQGAPNLGPLSVYGLGQASNGWGRAPSANPLAMNPILVTSVLDSCGSVSMYVGGTSNEDQALLRLVEPTATVFAVAVESALPLDNRILGTVRDVVTWRGDLYVAGRAMTINGCLHNGIARARCNPPSFQINDFNRDGLVDPDDLSDFISLFFGGSLDPSLDIDQNCQVDPDDLSTFISLFF